jgi:hypothetical protein
VCFLCTIGGILGLVCDWGDLSREACVKVEVYLRTTSRGEGFGARDGISACL